MFSRNNCIAELRRVASKLGHTPTQREYIKHGAISASTIVRQGGGGWTKSLEAAGLKIGELHKSLEAAGLKINHKSSRKIFTVGTRISKKAGKLTRRAVLKLLPSGHDVRRTIEKYGLHRQEAYQKFCDKNPELWFPSWATLLKMCGQHGWDWQTKKPPTEFWAWAARRFAANGVLPSNAELTRAGLEGFYRAWLARPDLFEGLRFDRETKTPQDWVQIAEELAKKHGRSLPCHHWLQQHGYSALASIVKRHPKIFKNIRQVSYKGTTPEEWVRTARKLVKEYSRVPPYTWLKKHGYGGMYQAKRIHPQLFKGIVFGQSKLIDDVKLKERVALARKLAKKYGAIPTQNWLATHGRGYSKLIKAMLKFPKAFAGIPRDIGSKSHAPEYYVPLAKKLARKNGDKIPSAGWLQKHGHTALNRAIHVHPEVFKQIEQEESAYRTPEEWLAIAKRIAPDGVFPPYPELERMGFAHVLVIRNKHPHLFKGFRCFRLRLRGEEVRRILKRYGHLRLDKVWKFMTFRRQHPELGLPRPDTIRENWLKKGWAW